MNREWRRSLITACIGLTIATAGDGAAQVVREGPLNCRAVALTFDLCPVRQGTGFDPALIEYLIEHRIPATFFASGRWMEKHDVEMRRLLAVPFFEMGTHGQAHAHLTTLDEGRQRAEIIRAVDLLKSRYGVTAPLFRPPFGEYNNLTLSVVRKLALQFILWSVISGDPDPFLSAGRMRAHVAASARDGSVIVFHANGKGKHTREVVETLIREDLPKRGLKPVTVSDLLACTQPEHR